MRRRSLLALVAVIIVSFALTAATAKPLPGSASEVSSRSTLGSESISIAAVANYGYQPETIGNVLLNATITVTFTDDDVLPHTFNISSREGFEIPNDYSASQLNALFSKYPPLYAATVSYEGDISIGSFTSPAAPGWYEFICNESGHFAEGMYGFIAFGEPVPSNLTLPSHGSETPVAGSGVILVLGLVIIVAILAGVVVLRRRRSAYRLPPEEPRHG